MTNTNKTNQTIDNDQARELYLYAVNTGTLYNETVLPSINMIQKHIKRGKYNEEKAIQYYSNGFARIALTRYKEEIGPIGTMNQATKNAFGKLMFESLKEQIFSKEGAN